jgi:1-acyl-sn-glycerol-3-phosphate acyltransferase
MLRSFIFNFFYIFWTLLIGIIFTPLIFIPQKYLILIVGKIWAHGLYFFLKYICGLSLNLVGKENIPTQGAIFASKHQSALETFMFHILINKPVFILKKELLNIPVFGFYLKRMGMIAIDRDGGMKSLKQLLKEVQEKISQGYNIIIFPEGTRTTPGEDTQYNPGVVALYNLKVAPVIPVALNTGVFWPKNSFYKKTGKFTINFLPQIDLGLNKEEFMTQLKQTIETNSKVI